MALFFDLLRLQGTLILLMLTGAVCRKIGMIDDASRRGLTSFCLDVIIPCNIIRSGMSAMGPDTLRSCALLLVSGTVILVLSAAANRFLFHRCSQAHRSIMQYSVISAMSGFFGNPIAEALYGVQGVLYVSVFLIPMRIAMWSVGVAYFVSGPVRPGQVVKKSLTNAGMIATAIGLFLMLTQLRLPSVLLAPVEMLGSCNTPVIMFIVGTFLADIDLRRAGERDVYYLSALRLLAIPALAWLIGWLLGLRGMALSISVFMSGAPAGATAPIFASRYGGDVTFATKCIVFTTLCSLLTLPMWCYLVQ